jgi:hypothetical protein
MAWESFMVEEWWKMPENTTLRSAAVAYWKEGANIVLARAKQPLQGHLRMKSQEGRGGMKDHKNVETFVHGARSHVSRDPVLPTFPIFAHAIGRKCTERER